MDKSLRTPLTGAAVAIAVTAIMDATGLAGLVINLVVLRILLGGNSATSWWAGPRPSNA